MMNESVLLYTQRGLLNYDHDVSNNPTVVNRQFSVYFIVSVRDCLSHSHQVLTYETLDQHETNCDYELQRCSVCRSEIPKKDLVDYENRCGSIQLSCPDCKLVYQRQEVAIKHAENICLKEQLRDLRRQLTDLQLAGEFEAPM